ncbi:MAG: DHH family phosphoesterase [Candidatus Berkelbacteria bacterium]|nr:DHH family phosphoesterase [Candidatus Berkelbacteria bacterium]
MLESSPKQQAVELIRDAGSILAVTHKNPDGDALGSLLALKISLEKLDKKVTIACPDASAETFSFLPKIAEIENEIDVSRDLIISVKTAETKIEKIGYKKDAEGKKIDIVVTPSSGKLKTEDVSVTESGVKFDLIIALDTPNLERLGKLAQPADIFYEIPVINIDHHPSNERFGKINWVELVATSTSEILVSLIEALSREVKLLDEDVATALLTGLIYDTSSFQNINTTPKSLTVAAQLVAAGARQQEIIKNLYKTKSLRTLRLWGIVLSNVSEDKEHKFLWSSVTKGDYISAGADESALSGVIDELLKSATEVDFVLLLSEREGQTHGSLRSISKTFNVAQVAESFGGGGHEGAAAFRMEGPLSSNIEGILSKVRNFKDKLSGTKKETLSPASKDEVEARGEVKEKPMSEPTPVKDEKAGKTEAAETPSKVSEAFSGPLLSSDAGATVTEPEAKKEEIKAEQIGKEEPPSGEDEPKQLGERVKTKW